MATDIKFNEKAGTFYTTVQPPAYSGTNGGLLHQTWGSRVAEISGRVRGLAGSVWVAYNSGDNYISFPVNYFSFIPVIDASVLMPKTAVNVRGYYENVLPGLREWSLDFTEWSTGRNAMPISDYIVPLHHAPVYLMIRNIGVGTFSILSSGTLYGAQNLFTPKFQPSEVDPLLVYWHAFGC